MRVLLTRAAADAARTRAALEELGHRVLVSPVIEIVRLPARWPEGTADGILATSGQAFAATADDWGPSPETRRLIPLWLVGARTLEVARQRGFLGAAVVAPNAVALAFEMSKRPGKQRVAYLAGRDRKPDMETALSVTEQPIEVVEMYEARAASDLDARVRAHLSAHEIDAALHFSRRSAALFASLIAAAGVSAPLLNLCLSEEVAAPLKDAGWTCLVAREPTERSLLAYLSKPT